MSRIGFIGTGHIAAPMARRMVALGHDVTVTERSASVSADLKRTHNVAVGTAQEVIDQSEILFICLRPSVASDILTPLKFHSDHQIISVMAEHDLTTLRQFCAPASAITRTIPLGFVEQGGCPLPVFGPAEIIHQLFGPDNIVLECGSEADMNALLTASAFMASQLDLMNTIAAWTQNQTGDTQVAEAYVKNLINGFLQTMPDDTGALAQERDALTLPGSLNHSVMTALQNAGTHTHLSTALDEVYKRLTQT